MFNFSKTLKTISAIIDDEKYTLTEASANVVRLYENKRADCTVLKEGKVIGIKDLSILDTFLLSLCITHDETSKHVDVDTLLAWPNRIVEPMVKWVKDNSLIDSNEEDEKAHEEEVKNE